MLSYGYAGAEGYLNLTQGAVYEHYGDKYAGSGINAGVGGFWGSYLSYTILFPGYTLDYWSRPGSRR